MFFAHCIARCCSYRCCLISFERRVLKQQIEYLRFADLIIKRSWSWDFCEIKKKKTKLICRVALLILSSGCEEDKRQRTCREVLWDFQNFRTRRSKRLKLSELERRMGHYAAVWDHKAAIEISKDWNGIDQVFLRNSRGASAKVSTFFSLVFMSLLKSSFLRSMCCGFWFLQISLHGGQVVSWRNDQGEELLFTSNKVCDCRPKPIKERSIKIWFFF